MLIKPKKYKNLFQPGGFVTAFGGSLANEFITAPFSVFDSTSDQWKKRRSTWAEIGLTKVNGRDLSMTYTTNTIIEKMTGKKSDIDNTSRFDPVLCEILYSWYCPPAGKVLDPFAGGIVRGIVASFLGLHYVGVDLSERQVNDNRQRGTEYELEIAPEWVQGDSVNLPNLVSGKYDFILSCPPYFDLEKYTDNPRDLSNLTYKEFLKAYRIVIAHAVGMLKQDSFACFVVGDIRDEDGYMRQFPATTSDAFEDAGARFYNDIVLLDPVFSGAVRARRTFEAAGKVIKLHQNVLVFVKGDPRKAFAKTIVGGRCK
jgi:DNA modification methylase